MTRLQQIVWTGLGLTVAAYGVRKFAWRTVRRHVEIETMLDKAALKPPPLSREAQFRAAARAAQMEDATEYTALWIRRAS